MSVLELMKSEKMPEEQLIEKEAVEEVITDTLNVVNLQRRKERKNAYQILGSVIAVLILLLFLDNMSWRVDTILFTCFGVLFPLFCAGGFLALLCSGILRKINGKPCGQTMLFAILLLCLLILFAGLFFLTGVLGIGPIPE